MSKTSAPPALQLETAPERKQGRPGKAATVSAKEAIQSALSRLSKPPLSDYEKCSIFPQKLMQLLKNEEAPDAIWWLQKGTAFAMQKEKFQSMILDKHFRGNKFTSIIRKLNRW